MMIKFKEDLILIKKTIERLVVLVIAIMLVAIFALLIKVDMIYVQDMSALSLYTIVISGVLIALFLKEIIK